MRIPASLAFVVVVIAACGNSKSSDSSGGGQPKRVSNKALVAAPLTSVAAKAGAQAFTIDLPMSLLKAPAAERTAVTFDPTDAWLDTPSFSVSINDSSLPPDYVGDTTPMAGDAEEAAHRKIARADKLADGGYINVDVRTDQRFFDLQVCRPLPAGRLCCSLIQRADHPIDAFDDMLKLGERVCRSMKAT